MQYCENCGNALGEGARCCSRCGMPVPGAESRPRDYWAERLGEKPPEDRDETTADREEPVPDLPESLPDRNPRRKITMVEQPSPGNRRKWFWILLGALVLAAGGLLLGLPLVREHRVPCQVYEGKLCMQGDLTCPGDGDWVKLYEDGSAGICLLSQEEEGSWTRQGDRLLLVLPDRILEGRERAGCLLLNWEDLQFLLALEGVTELPELTAPAPEPEYSRWAGDCYGWWTVTEAWGEWEENEDLRFDVCGRFWLEEANLGKLELWDTECGAGELFCAADFTVEPGLTESGCLRSGAGLFCGVPMEPGAWNVDPGREAYGKLENLTVLSGTCQRGSSGFSYLVYLRPWGADWEDVQKMHSGLLPEKNRLPERYADWYLPAIAAGESMPDSFPISKAENWE